MYKYNINETITSETNERGFYSVELESYGDSLGEVINNAQIIYIDQDGEEINNYDLEDACLFYRIVSREIIKKVVK